MDPFWLMRMRQWAKNPPSPAKIKLIFAVFALCLLAYGFEQVFGWPDALTIERTPSLKVLR